MTSMTASTCITRLRQIDACSAALDWLASPGGPRTMREAWETCAEDCWMTWLVGRAHTRGTGSRQRLITAILRWVEPICHLLPDESIADLGIVAAWTVGRATIEDVRDARDRLWSRRAAAAADRAAYAAYTYADAAAANAAYAAACDAAATADIIRTSITIDEVCAALGIDPDAALREERAA